MKRTLSTVILVMSIAASLAACGGGCEPTATTSCNSTGTYCVTTYDDCES